VSYDSTQTGAANDLLRQQPEPPAPDPVVDPTNFAVSQGEAGRGGPDSAAPTFTYQPGVDPELEMLVSLKNSGVDLDADEYLKATAYERDKIAAAGGEDVVMNQPVVPTVQTADAGILSTIGNYATDLGSDIYKALTFQDDVTPALVDAGKSAVVGLPENLGDMSTGLGNYFTTTAPLSFAPQGTTNPLLLGLSEAYKFMMPDEQKQDLLFSADPNREPSPAAGALLDFGTYLGETVAPAVESYLQPGNVGVFTGDTFENLNFVDATTGQQISGSDAVSGGLNLMGREGIADTGLDVALSLNPYTRAVSAALNAGEQLTGFATGISDRIENAYVNGQLDNNPVFQKALEAQGGNVDNALAVMKDFAYTASGESGIPGYAQIAGSGAVDALIPGISKGNAFISAAKEGVKRAGVEGAQGAFESYAAISAVNNALGTNFDPTENIVGAAATEGLAGSSAGLVSPILGQGLSATQRRGIKDSALGNQAAMEQAAGTQGVASFAVAPANQTAVSTQPEAMTTAPTVFNPNISPTAGELAQSNVPTAYDIEQDRVAGLLEAPQLDPMATSLDVMAAQEIIENQIRETGTISPEVMTNLQAATGLSMNDLSSMAVNASTGTLGGQTFPINVGSETPSDLMDQPTGIGGGSNISVEPLPSGETLLRNNDTGRTTVVDQGADLAAAIQTFDEVTTPFGAPEIDTTPVALPPFNVAGAPAQPVLPAGTDTSPVMPSAPQDPTIPEVDVAGLGSLTPSSRPDIDTSSLPEGIAAASTDTPAQLPATTDGDTLPAATGTEVIIDDDGSAKQVGGLEGEILGPEISTEVNPEEDTGVTIDMEAVTETDATPEIETDTVVSLPPTDQDTNINTAATTDQNINIKPLIEVDVDEPPEEPIVVEEEEPVVVEIDDDNLVPQITTTDKDGNTITECPEGYQEVQTPDGIMCEKITTTTTTTGRRTYGVGRTATTGLAGNIGRQLPRSRTRTRTTTSRSRVKPTTRSA
jgi:hypothetical protein